MPLRERILSFKRFFSYYKPHRFLWAAVLLSALLSTALALTIPLCVRHITKSILESGIDNMEKAILQTGAIMLAIIILKTGFSVYYDYVGHKIGAKIERTMRDQLFAHIQKLPLDFFDNRRTGELMSRLTNDLLNLAELYHHGPENLIIYGTQFIGAFVILSFINIKLALVICFALPFIGAYSFIFYSRLKKVYKANREQIANVNACAEESLSGMRVVKSFSNEDFQIESFKAENMRFYLNRTEIYKNESLHFTIIESFFTHAITIAIVVAGGIWISNGSLDPADLLVFILYSAYLTDPVPKLVYLVQQYQDGLSGYKRFCEIIDTKPETDDGINTIELDTVSGSIEFCNATFRYSIDNDYVLNSINLKVSAGETVAVVGHSGVGKTTLCSLIPRFYELNDGSILIDGKDIRTITLKSLRQHIGIVNQDTFLFAGTVLENILYGKTSSSKEDAIEAAKKASAHDFIMQLPNGYDTFIGQRGVKLSGGQRQRISIARVFLKNPPILIFDEATSSLDYESERAVMDSLHKLAENRTVFIIAHRLSTIKNANHIVVLTNEGIVEQGTHKQLYALKGTYTALYNS